jgi:hypothetical protein
VANLDDPDTGKEELIEFIVDNGVPTTKHGGAKERAKERAKARDKARDKTRSNQ